MRNNLQLEMSLIGLSRTCFVLNSFEIENVFHISIFWWPSSCKLAKRGVTLSLSLSLSQIDSVASLTFCTIVRIILIIIQQFREVRRPFVVIQSIEICSFHKMITFDSFVLLCFVLICFALIWAQQQFHDIRTSALFQ